MRKRCPVACKIALQDRGIGADLAIRIANDTEYGLTSAIFTRDIGLTLQIAARLETGCCHMNGPTVNDEAQVPLSSMKASGYGRFGGSPGMHEFTDVQWVIVEDPAQLPDLTSKTVPPHRRSRGTASTIWRQPGAL